MFCCRKFFDKSKVLCQNLTIKGTRTTRAIHRTIIANHKGYDLPKISLKFFHQNFVYYAVPRVHNPYVLVMVSTCAKTQS